MRLNGLQWPASLTERQPKKVMRGESLPFFGNASPAEADVFVKTPTLVTPPTAVASEASVKSQQVEQLVWVDGASDIFVKKVKQQLELLPSSVLEMLLDEGVSVVVKDLVTTGREDLAKKRNETGIPKVNLSSGIHLVEERVLIVSEFVQHMATGKKEHSLFWENAVFHELGHRLAHWLGHQRAKSVLTGTRQTLLDKGYLNMYGITESPEFVEAYQVDFKRLPDEVSKQGKHVGYYIPVINQVDPVMEPSRQEVFAESFDILMRGKASTYNYEHFHKYFPKSLAATAKLIRERFPEIIFHPECKI